MPEVYPTQTIYIYGLFDPRTNELRYVGKTNNLQRRYKRHLKDARLFPEFRVQNWIIALSNEGLKPEMQVIEECENEAWIEAERFYIAYFRALGCRLTNHDDGGRGMTHAPLSYRERLSQQRKGRKNSPEHIAKVAAALKGRIVPEDQRRKMSEAAKGRKRSLAARLKQGERTRGRKYDRDRVERSAAARSKSYVVTSPEGEEIFVTRLSLFCKERGIHQGNLKNVLYGKMTHYKGWKIRHAVEVIVQIPQETKNL